MTSRVDFVTLVLDPYDRPQHARFVAGLSDPCGGRVACEVTPGGRTRNRLAIDLLRGLGKRLDMTGASANGWDAWERVQSWIIGERARDLFVSRAHLLSRSKWETLIELCAVADARLWLFVQGTGPTRAQREAVRDWNIATIGFDQFEESWSDVQKTTPDANQARICPAVPDDEFPTFPAECRRSLSDEDFSYVKTIYDKTHDAMSRVLRHALTGADRRSLDEKVIATELAALLQPCSSIDEMVVRVRAGQAACLLGGYLVRVDREALAAGRLATPVAELVPAVARALRQFSHTHYAALGVVALASRQAPDHLARITIDDVREDGLAVTVSGREFEVPIHAAGIMRAHLAWRQTRPRDMCDALFISEKRTPDGRIASPGPTTPHGLQQQIRLVATETGVPLASTSFDRNPERWIGRRGMTVHRL
jgi:hypothetical protein